MVEVLPTRVVIERLIANGMSRDAARSHLQRQVESGQWRLDDRFNVVLSPGGGGDD